MMNLLIIEDSEFWLSCFEEYFYKNGHVADSVRNLAELNKYLSDDKKPDLVVCDWDLNGTPADVVLDYIVDQRPDISPNHFLLVSANSAASSSNSLPVLRKYVPVSKMAWPKAVIQRPCSISPNLE